MHKAKSIIHIQWRCEDNIMHSSSSSPQWLCGDMLAIDDQWRSLRVVSVRTSSDTLIPFSSLLNPIIHKMDNTPNNLCIRCREKDESNSLFIFCCKLSKVTLDYISKLINLSNSFNIHFKISLKTIIMGASSHF